MTQVGIGMIGCGMMGRPVARDVQRSNKRIAIRAIYDPDQRSIDASLKTFHPAPRICRDYHEVVNADDVDWVMIASWNAFHYEQALAALKAGKHIFCQKPLATNFEDCIKLKKAWETRKSSFIIGFTLRFSPHYRKIHRLIKENMIGDIVSMEFNETLDFDFGKGIMVNWRRLTENGGTHLLEKCCHDIDLANWMVGSRARRVASFGGLDFFTPAYEKTIRRIFRRTKDFRSGWGAGKNPFTSDKNIVDNQVAVIEYENNVRATFHTSLNAAIPERRMYILGTEGAIRANLADGIIEVGRIGHNTKPRRISTGAQGGHGGGDEVLAREVAGCMLRGNEPATGFEDALKSSIVCFAIDKAMETGRVVNLKPMWAQAGM